MGAKVSADDKVQARELNDVKNFYGRSDSDTSDDFKTKSRSTTDVCFLIFLTLFLIVLLCFLGYCVCNGDIFRIINGYDNCGNVCGRRNIIQHGEQRDEVCQEASTQSEPFHIIITRNLSSVKERKCVANCNDYEGYREFFHRCIPIKSSKVVNTFFSKTGIKNFFQEVSEDFHLCWLEFMYLCLISLAFSVLILILFRYLVGMVVWIVLIGVVLACCAGTVILWLMWNQSKNPASTPEILISDVDSRKTGTYFGFAIASSIVTVAVILIIIVMRKRIELVVQLFKEAGKAMASMPLLLFQPILTFVSLAIVVSFWFYFCLWIESSGHLAQKQPHVYYYEKDTWMKITRWYNLLAMLWMCQFVIGCQHMVIAGAISDWYFARNKGALGTPILKSSYNLIRYHLGSVALGSFLVAIVQLARVFLKFLEKYLHSHRGTCVDCALKCCHCCLYCFEKVLQYLNRNAYIEIAMYGYSFCHAGQQAFKLLVTNVLRVTAINSVGDFVLFLGKVLVVAATVLIGVQMLQHKEGLQHIWVPLSLAGLFAYFVAHCFMTVYEMAIDTIFLCFCEDCEQNDGMVKPYYMSRGLMEFVENSKKVLEVYDSRQRGNQNREQNIATVSDSVEKKTF